MTSTRCAQLDDSSGLLTACCQPTSQRRGRTSTRAARHNHGTKSNTIRTQHANGLLDQKTASGNRRATHYTAPPTRRQMVDERHDFGASELSSRQASRRDRRNRYSNGGTGTSADNVAATSITFSDSSGREGSGWLELSWNNFLGGPWRNLRVRDGSWTLMRVEGKWCFGGSRNRIRTATHNARGDLFVITEDGTRNGGRLEGPWIFMTSDDGVTIKGDFDFRANRVNWSTGFFWTWCGRN